MTAALSIIAAVTLLCWSLGADRELARAVNTHSTTPLAELSIGLLCLIAAGGVMLGVATLGGTQ